MCKPDRQLYMAGYDSTSKRCVINLHLNTMKAYEMCTGKSRKTFYNFPYTIGWIQIWLRRSVIKEKKKNASWQSMGTQDRFCVWDISV